MPTPTDPNLRLVVEAVTGAGSQYRVGERIERLLWAYCVANGITDEQRLTDAVAAALGTDEVPLVVGAAIARMAAAASGHE